MYSFGNIPFRVSRSKSSALRLRNSDYVIFNLFLSRYDANFFKLDAKNLQESIKRNFTQVFFCFLVLSTYFIKKIYFFLVIGSMSIRPSWWLFL